MGDPKLGAWRVQKVNQLFKIKLAATVDGMGLAGEDHKARQDDGKGSKIDDRRPGAALPVRPLQGARIDDSRPQVMMCTPALQATGDGTGQVGGMPI